jgi:hypothetical protein
MIFRFWLEENLIDEPVGFDATKMKLSRSENYHGIIAETDSQSVEFYGVGYQILKDLYDASGIDASMNLRIEYACENTFETLGEYSITFYNSEWYCGDDCYCKVGLERKGCIYQLKNAMETKVNLDSIVGIDGATSIGDYDYIGKEISIPSKAILFKDAAEIREIIDENNFTKSYNFDGNVNNFIYSYFYPPFSLVTLEELDYFSPLDILETSGGVYTSNPDLDSYYFFKSLKDQTIGLKGNIKGIFNITHEPVTGYLYLINIKLYKKNAATITLLDTYYSNTVSKSEEIESPPVSIPFDVSFLNSYSINNNDQLTIVIEASAVDIVGDAPNTFSTSIYETTNINITVTDLSEPTNCKLYMINESISKTSEYVTNGCLKVYSEFLGRTDSEPYNFEQDGCGGMLALTKGQLLRQLEVQLTGDQTPIFSISFMDILKALDSIYGIGYTIEERGDYEFLRIEDWQYFYQDNVMADIGSVSISKKPNLKLHFKRFRTGYNKYEAEEYNGIDEFLTEREYSTKLVNNNAVAEKVCDFIASGYAIELTRRKSYLDTKDWRFDADTFLLCTKRDGLDIAVEQGNINSPANIIDPNTILNFRISPARMAMNLFKYLTTFIKGTKELIFSNGKGNIAAQGNLDSVCSIEAGVISEKQNLTQEDFAGDQSGLFTAELHEVENVPLTFEQYKTIRANPHGLIAYKCDEVQRYGWIQSLEYSFVDGDATLILIPKNV